ncbi:MAG: ADP-ribosylglycohydrolase family protein, partial [Anaerolineales bacterium]
MPDKALEMANLPILTTTNSHTAHASQFHVLLYSLAAIVDTQLSGKDQALWLINEAEKYIPESSKVVDIVDFVRTDYLANNDVNNWESTRDKVYTRYQMNAEYNGFYFAGWAESSINFAVTIMALLYGEMDYRRTIQISTSAGWDADKE